MKNLLFISTIILCLRWDLDAQDFGNALNFNGVDDVVTLGDAFGFDKTDIFSVEAWVRVSPRSEIGQIISKVDGSIQGWGFQITANGRLSVYMMEAGFGDGIFVRGSTNIRDNNWHHVAFTYDGSESAAGVTVFLDGKTETLVVVRDNLSNSFANTADFEIGRASQVSEQIDGDIDELRIWDHKRSYLEINANLNSPLSGNEAGLLAYYNFDHGIAAEDNTGIITLVDQSANVLNGTLQNFDLSGSSSNWIQSCARIKDDVNKVAQYSFSGNANDESGYCNDGVVVNATLVEDRFGNPNSAYQFDGATTYIDMGNDVSLDMQSGVSISAWINRTGDGTFQTILGRGWASDGDYWLALLNTGSHYVLRFWLEGQVYNGTAPVPDGWNHVALVAETGTNGLKLYLNGALYEEFTIASDLLGSSIYNLRIGNDDRDESYYFNGIIDDVTIYTRPLSAQEIEVISTGIPLDFEVDEPSFGNALDLDGNNDFIDVPSDTLSEVYNGFSIESWVKWAGNPATPDENNVIFQIVQGFGQIEGRIDFKVNGFSTACNGQRPCSYWIDNTQPLDNDWHHLAVTVDVEAGLGYYYVDGVVTGSIDINTCIAEGKCSDTGCNLPSDSDPAKLFGLVAELRNGTGHRLANLFTIGRNTEAVFFAGQIDELRIWNYPRTAAEIGAYRYVPLSGEEDGLVYYFDFNQGEGGGTNTGITGLPDERNKFEGELLGFGLTGGSSNWVVSDFNDDNPNIPVLQSIYPKSSIAGQTATIYGSGVFDDVSYYKVFFGEQEGVIKSIDEGVVKVEVPEGSYGLQRVRMINSFGSSNDLDYTIISELSQLPFSWDKRTIYSEMTPQFIDDGDVNADGFIDIVSSGNSELVYSQNDGTGQFESPMVISIGSEFGEANLEDVDGDGDLDVLCTEDNIHLAWYENINSGATWVRRTILSSQPDMSIEPIDIDRDGDTDLLVYGSDHGIKILYNDGTGSFSTPSVLMDDRDYFRPHGLVVNDFNNDGFFDFSIVVPDDSIFIFTNNLDGTFAEKKLGKAALYAEISATADINNDGLQDIVNIGFQPGYNWYINEDGNNYNQTVSSLFTAGANALYPGDMNGDGLVDFLAGMSFDKNQLGANVKWFRSRLDFFNEYILEEISNEVYNVKDVRAIDLDNDGDLDVVSASADDNRVTTFFHVFSDNDFETFSLDEQVADATIETILHRIHIPVTHDAILSKLVPRFTTSNGAHVELQGTIVESGSEITDFSDPGNSVIYSIVAENGDEQEWIVTVYPLPGVPELEEAENITNSSVDLTWSDPGYATSYQLFISSDGFDTFETHLTDDTNIMLSVSSGTTYRVAVKGVNAYGLSESFSNVIDFQTIPAVSEITSVSEVGPASVVLNWQFVIGVNQYQLDVAKDEFFTDFVGGYESRGIASLSESVINLSPGTNYWAQIRSGNNTGYSDNSDPFTFITIPDIPTLTTNSIEQHTIELSWESIVGAAGYEVEMLTSGGETVTFNYDAATLISTHEDLEPAHKYLFRIRSFNSSGFSEYSEYLIGLTIPDTPGTITLDLVDQTELVIDWIATPGAASYLIELSDDNFSTLLSGYNPKNTNNTTELVANLTPGEEYSIRIRSQNETGESPNSDVTSVYTLPATPVARDASAVTTTTFNANWDAVSGDNITYTLAVADNAEFIPVHVSETIEGVLSFQLSGLDVGVSYWYGVRANNTSGSSPFSNVIFVEQPLVVNDLTYSETMSQSAGNDTPITFSVTGGQNVHNVIMRYKGVLDPEWNEEVLTVSDGGYLFTVRNDHLDEVGLSFEIEVNDGVKTYVSEEYNIAWSDIDADVPIKNLGEQWQMFSIPYVLEDALIESVFDELAQFEYLSEWRIMHYDGTKYVDAGSGISRIELGKGYWFNSNQEVEISFNNADVNTQDPYTIDLHAGWNQIGNPFNVNISWNDVRSTNDVISIVEGLIQYDEVNQLFIDEDVMEPFSAGFVWADQAETIDISSTANRSIGRTISENQPTNNIDEEQWLFAISIKNGNIDRNIATIGMHPQAIQSKDQFDRTSLPRLIDYLEMYTYHGDYFYPWFEQDVVTNTNDHSWLYTLESNFVRGMTTLHWDNRQIEGASRQLWLIDEITGRTINMNQVSEAKFNFDGNHQFSIHLTPDISSRPLPYSINLGDPYPNPTQGTTRIDVLLPTYQDIYDVDLAIYDIHGRKVVDVAHDRFGPGIHTFESDMHQLQHIKSGIYFYKLSIPNSGLQPFYKKLIFKN